MTLRGRLFLALCGAFAAIGAAGARSPQDSPGGGARLPGAPHREELLTRETGDCLLRVPMPWGPPLPPPLRLTGTFGEHRSGHLHAGIDLSTGGQIGMPVLAVADGSIVRMRAGAFGYGRALYLETDAGALAVYGHLDRFVPVLEHALRERQSAQGEYEIDCWLPSGGFRFARGDTLALSGATGVGPPHLHFELRDGDVPVNPLTCGLAAPDLGGPEIGPVALHALGPQAWVADDATLILGDEEAAAPRVWGPVGIEAYLIDRSGTTGARLAPLGVRLFLDGTEVFERRFAAIDFARDAEVGRIYGRLARDQGPFALRLYRWPPGAPADQTERGPSSGVLAFDALQPGAHRLCLEVTEAGGYSTEASWQVAVRAPLLAVDWQAAPITEETWQLGLRLAEPYDSLRLPLRLRTATVGSARGAIGAEADGGEWACLGQGWFAAPLTARVPTAVRVTDDRGAPLLPWIALEETRDRADSPARGAAQGAAELRVDFSEGFLGIGLNPGDLLRGLPQAYLECTQGRRWPLVFRGAADGRTWRFGLAPGGFVGRAADLVLIFAEQERGERRWPLEGVIGLAADGEADGWELDAGSGLRLRGRPGSFYGPALLGVAIIRGGDPDWEACVDGDGRVAWRHGADAAGRLPICSPLLRIDPGWWPLQGEIELRLARELLGSAAPGAEARAPDSWGLCRCDAAGDWSWVGGVLDAAALTATVSQLGFFAVLSDLQAPVCSDPSPADGAPSAGGLQQLTVQVDEIGSGFDPRAADLFLDGEMLLATWDADARELSAELERPLDPGAHHWEVRITDRAGNRTQARYRFTMGE